MKHRIPILFVLALVAACGTSRVAILSRTQIGLEAARATFVAEDERVQQALVQDEAIQREIVAAAPTEAAARSAIADYRQKRDAQLAGHRRLRDAATKAYQVACLALAAAAIDPSDANMARLVQLGGAALQALSAMGVL